MILVESGATATVTEMWKVVMKFDVACRKAMNQIQEHDYTSILGEDDMQTILKYGIACYKKTCKVVMEYEM